MSRVVVVYSPLLETAVYCSSGRRWSLAPYLCGLTLPCPLTIIEGGRGILNLLKRVRGVFEKLFWHEPIQISRCVMIKFS
ncbi:hypothetical protein L1987_20989 [Smallanthus sonchifolius]|uniref:Uncharacterized protein n=1 Tax=Smallanthus sonchifolius TaxID=185202 RepID=A0ACB9ISL2_9ASTR|nr:hypothetical protein L1987_20989 [Smallanthus sonchifolius]